MKKKFEFEFEDLSSKRTISFEYANEGEEKMSIMIENGIPVIYANREAFLLLAKTCAKIGLGEYSSGFHVHLRRDFDADQAESIRLVLDNES
jgi:hypothetical protein